MHTPEVRVIDEELLKSCVADLRKRVKEEGEDALDVAPTEVDFAEAEELALSYKFILKIDNLAGFDRLVKLSLDCNIIERIENLDHLVNLEWLGEGCLCKCC